jgi:hypothetical protein
MVATSHGNPSQKISGSEGELAAFIKKDKIKISGWGKYNF